MILTADQFIPVPAFCDGMQILHKSNPLPRSLSLVHAQVGVGQDTQEYNSVMILVYIVIVDSGIRKRHFGNHTLFLLFA